MVLKWCTKFDIVSKRCPINFQGHLSNFKFTQDTKLPILTTIEHFQTVTPFEFTNSFQIMHNAWQNIEKMPYYFSKSSNLKITQAKKNDDLNAILVRSGLQLSNPSDLSCYELSYQVPELASNLLGFHVNDLCETHIHITFFMLTRGVMHPTNNAYSRG